MVDACPPLWNLLCVFSQPTESTLDAFQHFLPSSLWLLLSWFSTVKSISWLCPALALNSAVVCFAWIPCLFLNPPCLFFKSPFGKLMFLQSSVDSVECFYFDSQFIFFRVTLVILFSPPPTPTPVNFLFSVWWSHSFIKSCGAETFWILLGYAFCKPELCVFESFAFPLGISVYHCPTRDLLAAWFTIV